MAFSHAVHRNSHFSSLSNSFVRPTAPQKRHSPVHRDPLARARVLGFRFLRCEHDHVSFVNNRSPTNKNKHDGTFEKKGIAHSRKAQGVHTSTKFGREGYQQARPDFRRLVALSFFPANSSSRTQGRVAQEILEEMPSPASFFCCK